MADDITNGMLLQHMQGMKNDLQQQLDGLNGKMDGLKTELKKDIGRLDNKITLLSTKMDQGFEDARRHREALQEDLEETMRVQGKHGVKLARL